jgi:hypothetical protein
MKVAAWIAFVCSIGGFPRILERNRHHGKEVLEEDAEVQKDFAAEDARANRVAG